MFYSPAGQSVSSVVPERAFFIVCLIENGDLAVGTSGNALGKVVPCT